MTNEEYLKFDKYKFGVFTKWLKEQPIGEVLPSRTELQNRFMFGYLTIRDYLNYWAKQGVIESEKQTKVYKYTKVSDVS